MMRDKPNPSQRRFECRTCEHFDLPDDEAEREEALQIIGDLKKSNASG
jgi:hypothetical protein